jgi:hypothetical protein
LSRKALGCQVLHHPGPKITTKFTILFLKFDKKMKEEAQGFPTAWGSTGFPLHPNALWVSENEFIFGKSKLTMGKMRKTREEAPIYLHGSWDYVGRKPRVLRYLVFASRYSGFLYEPQLASRDAGAPPARRARRAVGGTGHVATRNRQEPSSEFGDVDFFIELRERGA